MQIDNPIIPPDYCLFKPESDHYGSRLALVFGNEATDGKCPFYDNGCEFCDIGSGESIQFTHEMNHNRLDFFRRYYKKTFNNINHVVLYNSGSILNPEEMSFETLSDILSFIRTLPSCRSVSVESREVFVKKEYLESLIKMLSQDIGIRIIIGLETQNDHIREEILHKGISKENFEKAFEVVSEFSDRIGIDINILLCPPPLIKTEAINDAIQTVDYGISLRNKYGVNLNFNLHPYYNTAKGKRAFSDQQELTTEEIERIALLVNNRIKRLGADSRVFIGAKKEIKN